MIYRIGKIYNKILIISKNINNYQKISKISKNIKNIKKLALRGGYAAPQTVASVLFLA
jgi:hypothetical protein